MFRVPGPRALVFVGMGAQNFSCGVYSLGLITCIGRTYNAADLHSWRAPVSSFGSRALKTPESPLSR